MSTGPILTYPTGRGSGRRDSVACTFIITCGKLVFCRMGKRLHEEVGFDVVHHVTFVNYWTPSFLTFLPLPFIWEPVGGSESFPKAFFRAFGSRGKIYEYLRDVERWFGEHDPFVRHTARRAQVGFATTPQTESRLKQLKCPHVEVLSQLAMSGEEVVMLGSLPLRRTSPFRLVSIGNLLHWKGFHLGLKAFVQFQQRFPESEYYVIGDGPERRNLESMVRECGLVNKVRFWGKLPRQQVLAKLAECDVLVHPSLHDSGRAVCLEAMAAERPVICSDLGEPALQVTEESGIKIPAVFPKQAVDDIAQAMLRLARGAPGSRVRMGQAARNRVAAYLSDEQGERIKGVYKEVLGGKCLQ